MRCPPRGTLDGRARRRVVSGREGATGNQRVADDAAADEMFLDDPLEHRRVALAVPRAFGIDDRDRSAFANPQAVGLGAQDAALVDEAERLQPRLQVLPGREPPLLLAALR